VPERAFHLTHEEFDTHWRDQHAASTWLPSGTCHEHRGRRDRHGSSPNGKPAPCLNGKPAPCLRGRRGLLGFAPADDWTNGLFGDRRARGDYEDILFLDLGKALPAASS
jgi:hypothetical protein